MFGIGFTEFILILIVALIVLGPEKLPEIAKALGRAYLEFKKAGEELKKSVDEATLKSREAEKATDLEAESKLEDGPVPAEKERNGKGAS